MTAPTDPASATELGDRAAQRGSRIAMMIFLVLSSLFILSSTWQLGRAVFSESEPPLDHRGPAPCQ
jgi:hypothetical protein